MLEAIRKFLRKIPNIELTVLLLAVIIAAGIWGFVELADEVMEGDTHQFDRAILLSMRNNADRTDPLGPYWIEEMGRDFTGLGGVGILILLTAATTAYLVLIGKKRVALLVVLSVAGAMTASTLLKMGFQRDRPDLVPHLSMTSSTSFPSGHTMMSTAVYLLLGALLARMHAKRPLKAFFLVCAITVSVLVGISRVYLGVHWPTDVVAGWAAGAVWASLCWLLAWWLQQRHQIEPSTEAPEPDHPDHLPSGDTVP